ncbi:MAG TPA: response regulator transcription factor [Segetibacter sp.]|jgi:DNA-binding response OmpR family regulator
MSNPKILFVEDDKNLGYILSEYLALNNFDVTWVSDGKEALTVLNKSFFDLCILDVMLPNLDGFSIADELRRTGSVTPFIFLTAKSLKIDKLKGFKYGCDDYIIKPVDEEELIARIKVVLKRTGPKETSISFLKFGKCIFHKNEQRIVFNDKEEFQLTNKEAEVLHELAFHKNNITNRDLILKKIWGSSDFFNRRSMDVIISRLRKHLQKDDSITIRNIHGKGYILEEL